MKKSCAGLKRFLAMYRKERKEHPTMSAHAVRQIVKDHFRKRR